jgi:group I intron endonuclease
MSYCIYKHTSPSGKSYIGQTNDYKRRCIEHKKESSGSLAFRQAIKKYGWDNFIHEILVDGLNIEEANLFEELHIAEYKTIKPSGYNLTTGGGNARLTEEGKEKIRKANTGKQITEETREKLRASHLGYVHTEEQKIKIGNASRGKKQSAELVEKRRLANIGKIRSEETRKKISLANTGKKHSEEWKELNRLRNIGEGNPNYGKVASEETRKKISEGGKKRFEIMDHPMLGKKHSEEALLKMSQAKIGNTNRLGISHTDETKKKISESKKIYFERNPEAKKKISEGRVGIVVSNETREKLSASIKEVWRLRKLKSG